MLSIKGRGKVKFLGHKIILYIVILHRRLPRIYHRNLLWNYVNRSHTVLA